MFNFNDVKMMFDWGRFTEGQVREFMPLRATDEETDKVTSEKESTS